MMITLCGLQATQASTKFALPVGKPTESIGIIVCLASRNLIGVL